MIIASLKTLFKRDLDNLIEEIHAFEDENHLWQTTPGISNSAGNLTLHLCGNLKHFIGAILGHTGYIRQRELEFSSKNISSPELIKNIEETATVVEDILNSLDQASLENTYPVSLWDKTFTTEFFLIHLHSHLNYHLGQINYLRRIISEA